MVSLFHRQEVGALAVTGSCASAVMLEMHKDLPERQLLSTVEQFNVIIQAGQHLKLPAVCHPVWPKYPNSLKPQRKNMMVHFDEEDATSAAVGVRYRNGEPATAAAE